MSTLAVEIERRRSAGFGYTWGDFNPPWPGSTTTTNPPPITGSIPPLIITERGASNPNPFMLQLPALISTGLRTIRDIWGPEAAVAQYSSQTGAYRPVAGQNAPPGWYYNESGDLVKQSFGNVTDFISNNPILVAVVAGGVVLLFLKPPGRR